MTSAGNEHWTCNKCLPGEEITKTVISRTLSSIDLMGSLSDDCLYSCQSIVQ